MSGGIYRAVSYTHLGILRGIVHDQGAVAVRLGDDEVVIDDGPMVPIMGKGEPNGGLKVDSLLDLEEDAGIMVVLNKIHHLVGNPFGPSLGEITHRIHKVQVLWLDLKVQAILRRHFDGILAIGCYPWEV